MNNRFEWLPSLQGRSLFFVMTLVMLVQFLAGCDYGRMKDDEAINTFQFAMPEMPKKAVPTNGGIQMLRNAKPDDLKNPLSNTAETLARGRETYGFYCGQCHGPRADGYGTVGQSFAPLPANLKSPEVQGQSDGWLYYKINLGFNRHPPLWDTIAAEDGWAVIWHIRSLAGQPKG